MIYGIGIDIVAIHRINENIEQYDERFAEKILSDKEMEAYRKTHNPVNFLAKHFAAKEAFVKALGTGFRNGINLKSIQIEHLESGQPVFQYNEKLSEVMHTNGIISCHISLSDEQEYACACVILEK